MLNMYSEDLNNDTLIHYGTPRHSGRYPWGSGENPYQHNKDFLARNNELKKAGVSEHDRAIMLGCRNIDHLRAKVELSKAEVEKYNVYMAQKLKDKGYSNTAIAERMGTIEGNVRNYLKKSESGDLKIKSIEKIEGVLLEELARKGMIDVGSSTNLYLGVSPDKLKKSLERLKDQGYNVYTLDVMQQGTGKTTTFKVLCDPDTTWKDMYENRYDIRPIDDVTIEDGGHGDVVRVKPPQQIDGNRIYIRYAEEGGVDRDGTIELRRGVKDLDMGDSLYAQVRIAVDNKSYLKGVAVYRDDIPDGYDIVFNTNKKAGTAPEEVFKNQKDDPMNPFGSAIAKQKGALNIVREEGDWSDWSKNLPAQFLAKQPIDLARKQLKLTTDIKNQQLEDILSVSNATLRKKMLLDFGEECDADAVALKATAMPRQATHVILPVPSMSEHEVYAPGYQDGEKVVLVRFPHGGKFEIPELTVNNKNKDAKKFMNNAKDAVGISPKVAAQLSGADFDGDTVLVIPNNGSKVKTLKAWDDLKNFDPKDYAVPKGSTPTKKGWEKGSRREGTMMGMASNLITDMTLQGASKDELIRAVKYSMVVIDTGKHKLDWGQAEADFGIKALKDKYQGHVNEKGNYSTGANSLISRSKSQKHVLQREDRYDINPDTGEIIYKTKIDKKTGQPTTKMTESTQMHETKDARTLLGPNATDMEKVYADYANSMKALGNRARKEYLKVVEPAYNPAAKKKYATQVASLNAKLVAAQKNDPLERQAQLLAGQRVAIIREDNPGMSAAEIKKARGRAIVQSRKDVGAEKARIEFTEDEWEAMNSGAVSKTTMTRLFDNAKNDKLMKRALPKENSGLTPARLQVAKSMLNAGSTLAEVAEHFGVSVKTLSDSI